MTGPTNPPSDRAAWLRAMRREDERQEDALAPAYDAQWGEIGETHAAFVAAFLARLPPRGRVLDAACGTGKYFGMVLDSGRSPLGVDHSGGALAVAATKFPRVRTEQHVLQELPFRDAFDGVLCVDAMEFVPPDDWPRVLGHFHRALRPHGWLYLTVELAPDGEVWESHAAARAAGLPVVAGEVMWGDGEDAYYHFYPDLGQVRAWVAEAGFVIAKEAAGPRHEDGYAYHHVLARKEEAARSWYY